MNNNYKYLAWAGTGVLMVLAIFLLASTDHIINSATNSNTVSFTGEGRVFAKPDVAVISFSILTEAQTSKAAQDDNSKKSQKVTEFIKTQGIEDKDLKTSGYNVYPQYGYPRPCTSYTPCTQSDMKITGYQVNQSFELKVRDLNKVSPLLDGLVAQGANQVNNLGFRVDDIEKIKDQAREKAITDAKEKASKLKNQVGIRLGKIVNFYEGGNNYPIYYEAKAMDSQYGIGGGAGGAPTPAVPAGENEIVVSVTITYQIK